jgi:hypothetical protein
MMLFWIVTQCELVGRHQSFGETYRLHRHLHRREKSCISNSIFIPFQYRKARILIQNYFGLEILTAASMKMAVFWVVAPCSLLEVYQRFRGICYNYYNPGSHLQN